jgi:hypothetical protein
MPSLMTPLEHLYALQFGDQEQFDPHDATSSWHRLTGAELPGEVVAAMEIRK